MIYTSQITCEGSEEELSTESISKKTKNPTMCVETCCTIFAQHSYRNKLSQYLKTNSTNQ
jgi:hypothetical protein